MSDNIPLRQHLAETLLGLGRLAEAEKQYRELLKNQPDDGGLKVALANVYSRAEKNSQAMVIVENLLKRPENPASALVLRARLLVQAGEFERAVR